MLTHFSPSCANISTCTSTREIYLRQVDPRTSSPSRQLLQNLRSTRNDPLELPLCYGVLLLSIVTQHKIFCPFFRHQTPHRSFVAFQLLAYEIGQRNKMESGVLAGKRLMSQRFLEAARDRSLSTVVSLGA